MRSQLPNNPQKSCRERASSQPPKEFPVTSDAEHHQAEDSSDSEFVLPALGGPDPHNKFDGMEWVDIKGMDDDKLQDISTDLRLYYKRMNGCWNALNSHRNSLRLRLIYSRRLLVQIDDERMTDRTLHLKLQIRRFDPAVPKSPPMFFFSSKQLEITCSAIA